MSSALRSALAAVIVLPLLLEGAALGIAPGEAQADDGTAPENGDLKAKEDQAQEPLEEDRSEEPPPLVKNPELLEYVQAPYPEQAMEEGREGVVRLLIEIDEVGDVSFIEVIDSAGEDFDSAAIEAAWNFVFSPAEDESGAVPVQIEFEYGFLLDVTQKEGAVEDAGAAEQVELPVNLEGVLLEMGTKRPLEGFTVQATHSDGTTQESLSDENGAYSFRGSAPGETSLLVVHPEYERQERSIEVREGEVTSLRIWLKNLNYREDELVSIYRKPSADVSRRTISVEEIKRIPGTFGDPVRVIQNLPGAARAPFGSGVLVIRGANPEDSAVYVDGIRIPIIYHLGGYVSVINSDLIDSVDYLPGSYSVKYGRSLGGVVDVKTKRDFPEQGKFKWSTDVLDSGGVYVGHFGDYGVAAAARRSYIDLFIPIFTRNSDFVVKPRWYDYQLKVDRLDKSKDRLSFFLFGFQDKLVASTPDSVAQGTDPDTQGDFGTTYSTHRAYVRWVRDVSDDLQVEFLPSFGVDHIDLDVGGGLRVEQVLPTLEVRLESRWRASDALSLTTGLDFIGGGYDFTASLPFSLENASSYDPLAERDPVTLTGNGLGLGPDFYVNAELHPLKDRERWRLDLGQRISPAKLIDFDNDQTLLRAVGIDPRMSTRFNIFEKGTLKAGAGLYTQPPQPFELWRPEGATELTFERAMSAEAGWEQRFTESLEADVSLFGKKLDRLVVQNPDVLGSTDLYYTNEGIGRVYGLEAIIRQAAVGRFFGWISYTLSRSERNDYPDREITLQEDDTPGSPSTGDWYLFDLDQTHILVAVAGWSFPKDLGVSGKLQYVTGNPYTAYSGGVYDIDQDFYFAFPSGNYNSERLPPFFAIDLRLDKLFTYQKWQMEVYVDLLNTVRGENPEFTLYNYDYTESVFIRGLPFIPSVGLEAEFYF
jgi:TonB family protein